MQDWQALRAKGDVETAVLLRAGDPEAAEALHASLRRGEARGKQPRLPNLGKQPRSLGATRQPTVPAEQPNQEPQPKKPRGSAINWRYCVQEVEVSRTGNEVRNLPAELMNWVRTSRARLAESGVRTSHSTDTGAWRWVGTHDIIHAGTQSTLRGSVGRGTYVKI